MVWQERLVNMRNHEDVCDGTELTKYLHTKWLGQQVHYEEIVDSTNNVAKQLAKQGGVHGTVVFANQQLAGKGRLGRNWITKEDEAITVSYLLKPDIMPSQASQLTMVAAVAVACAIEEVTGLSCQIKWPNDIVIDGKKVCGILTEMAADMEQIHYVVVGIGVNVNSHAFAKEIEQTAISLSQLLHHKVDRMKLLAAMLQQFEQNYEIFMETKDLTGMLKSYNDRLVNCDREVVIIEKEHRFQAIARCINAKGELIVEVDGQEKKIVSGEVSVRGIYGYV